MTAQRKDFGRAIANTPDDPRLRLEYAESLYAGKDYLAALEQVQSGLDCSEDDLTANALKEMEQRLISDHIDALAGPAAALVVKEQPLRVENNKLVEVVLGVSSGDQPYLITALESPWFDHLEYLGLIIDDIGNDIMGIVSASPLPALSDMSVWTRGRLDEQAIFAFAVSRVAQRLEALYLRGELLTDNMVEALATRLPRLQELRLRSEKIHGITERSAFCIADSPVASRLTRLGLVGTSIGERGALALATSTRLSRLEVLELRDGVLTNEGARILAASSSLRRLARLDVSRNRIDEVGLVLLRNMGIEVRLSDQHPAR